ncbi:MAG: ABC transporter permease [Rhodospirillales bacterium]|nr:ABC transporter permease [Rhodospirillales bacterium]
MLRNLARRAAVALATLLVVSALIFAMLRLLPAYPAATSLPANATRHEIAAVRHAMGLDHPWPVQYAAWLGGLVHGDFGQSLHRHRPVARLLRNALPATIELTGSAMVIALVLGVGGGLLLFALRGRRAETALDMVATLGMSLPAFVWGLLFIVVFGVTLNLLPFAGRLAPDLPQPPGAGFLLLDSLRAGRLDIFWSALRHLVMPAFALGIAFAPPIARMLHTSLLRTWEQDYIRQARLRGLSETRLLFAHALRNAAAPSLIVAVRHLGFLLGGSLVVEVIFGDPGIGSLMVGALRHADLPVIEAVGLTYCVMVLVIKALADGLALLLDPRLRRS